MIPERLAAAGVEGPDVGRLQRAGRIEVEGDPALLRDLTQLLDVSELMTA